MIRQRALETDTSLVEHTPRPLDSRSQPFDFSKPWLRTDEAAAYVGYRGKHALRSFYRFLKKKGVPTARRFRTLLVMRADLDRAIGAGHRKRV